MKQNYLRLVLLVLHWVLSQEKIHTIYAWDTPVPAGEEPDLWFRDILRQDGTPFSKNETTLIKKLNQSK